MESIADRKPWLAFYGSTPKTLRYPDRTMYGLVRERAAAVPDATAYDFMGTRSTYAKLVADVDAAAEALAARGLKKGDTVTVSLPNCPQALILFYALNRLGVRASMIHPLSAPTEIEFYLRQSSSKWLVTLDAFYGDAHGPAAKVGVETHLLVSIGDALGIVKRLGFWAKAGRKIRKPPEHDRKVLRWKDLLATPSVNGGSAPADAFAPDEAAVILYSGGTTGLPKGILLSSRNFNALGLQIGTQGPIETGDTILSILPMFHGFGLGVCVHAFMIAGGTCVLVPRFTSETVAKLIKTVRPQYMAGVPTLYESLLRDPNVTGTDLSCFKGIYAGGDKLPQGIKERFDALLAANNGKTALLEGYGLTESVTACVTTPVGNYRPGSIGIPLPDMLAKVCMPGTEEELPPGEDGELCVSGPTLMQGYLNSPEDTASTLRVHADGRTWLHTGDLCSIDSDGFIYFRLRMKRIVKVSGVSVSPVTVEETLDSHPDVDMSCVIGVPDEKKLAALKAFVVLKDRSKAGPGKAAELIEYCKGHLITWSVPRSIEFRETLPLTRIGKVAWNELEKEEASKAGS